MSNSEVVDNENGYDDPSASSELDAGRSGGCESVDSAYYSIETKIRNFNRERIAMDECITSLKRQLEVSENSRAEISSILKGVTLERDKALHIHEEDEKARFVVEAMVTSCEEKINILIETLGSFSQALEVIMGQSEGRDAFNQIAKRIQLQLFQTLKDMEQEHEDTINNLRAEGLRKDVEVKKLNSLNTGLAEKMDLISNEILVKSDLIKQLTNQMRDIESQLIDRTKAFQEKEVEMQQNGLRKENEIKELQNTNKELTAKVESLSKEVLENSDAVVQLTKEKQDFENQLIDQTKAAKEKEDEMFQQNLRNEDDIKVLQRAKDEITLKLDCISKECLVKSDTIVQLIKEKQDFENQLIDQTKAAKEKEDEMLQQSLRKEDEIKELQNTNTELAAKVESLSKEVLENSDAIVQLTKDRQDLENQLIDQTKAAKEKEDEMLQQSLSKEDEIRELQSTKDEITLKLELASKECLVKSDTIVQLTKQKQDVENQLLVQMRLTKDKENELQESEKLSSKHIQVSRQWAEDLSGILETSKKERALLQDEYNQLSEERKRMEVQLTGEITVFKDTLKQKDEELETLRLDKKRYLDLKKHLSCLMKEKSSAESNSQHSNSKSSQSLTSDALTSSQLKGTAPVEQEHTQKEKTVTPRPTFRRSCPPPSTRSPRSILKNQVETAEKKIVSFCSPLAFCEGLTSSSDSSPEEADFLKSPHKVLTSTPKKRSNEKMDQDSVVATEEKKSKTSSEPDTPGRKFFQKKPTATATPSCRVQK